MSPLGYAIYLRTMRMAHRVLSFVTKPRRPAARMIRRKR